MSFMSGKGEGSIGAGGGAVSAGWLVPRAEKTEIAMLCPQYGAIYWRADVTRFIIWFAELNVGAAIAV